MSGTVWGSIELEPEVQQWVDDLDDEHFGRAAFYIDLLAERGVHLGEPYTRQLKGKLRELRFYMGRQSVRVTYYVATGRRIVLLTVFSKTKRKEPEEITRAWSKMMQCIDESHTAEED